MQTHIRVEMPWTTGLPDDLSVNTFTITTGTEGSETLSTALLDLFAHFYNEVPGSLNGIPGAPQPFTPTRSVSQYLSPVLSRTASVCTVTAYHLTPQEEESGLVGPPDMVQTFTLDAAFGDGLPPETHLAVTFEAQGRAAAAVESGVTRPKQRRTGHIKLGPLDTSALNTVGEGIGRPNDDFRYTVLAAVNALQNGLSSQTPQLSLGVWSRADNIVRPVEFVSIDDSFDTLEKRSLNPTVRTRVDINVL